jgi:CheY-like chemotaxis protein
MRILIADDDITSRTVLSAVLQKNGHEVVGACDGNEALAVLEGADAPRLAILDWMMPGMDGIGICQRVRARESDRPPYLMMLTTRGEKTDVSAGLRAGANDYLAKPFNAVELTARVEVGCRFVELEDRLAAKVRELQEAMAQIKTLSGIVPICSSCKKIRDDAGYWKQVELFVGEHTDATFTHGICPDCMAKLYPEYATHREHSGTGAAKPAQPGTQAGAPASGTKNPAA